MRTNADIFRDTQRACDRDDEIKAATDGAVASLIRMAQGYIEQGCPHTAAARLEEAAQTLRLTARNRGEF